MSNNDYLETTYDKFIFRVARGYYYSRADVWVKLEDGAALLGVSDFLQRRSGDAAFVEPVVAGTQLQPGDEFAHLETIKADIVLPSPVSGTVVATNDELLSRPELVNEDPYGEGWIVRVRLTDWAADQANLLDAAAYFPLMQARIEEEGRKLR
jgi:glycine cleavage system H protein